jgi:hypothetical protein
MATYTPSQLYGGGILGENISNSTLFTFTNPAYSSYFTLETIQNANGFYDSSSSKNALGTWGVTPDLLPGFVTSSYIASIAVPPNTSSIMFTPSSSITGVNYYLRGTGAFSMTTFSPPSLFASGEKGVWFDASDLSTLFQDAAGTVPVTTVGQPVGKWLDKSGNNNHATTAGNRPTYQIDPEGNPNVTFTKTPVTQLATSAINFTGTAQMTVCVGVNVLDSSSAGVVIELGSDVNSVNGSFLVGAPSSTADHSLYLRGTTTLQARVNNVVDGDDIITGLFDISQATKELELIPRLNYVQLTGSQITWTGTDAGTGNFGNLPLYLGSRSGLGIPYGGKIYQVIVRGATSNTTQVYQTETFIDYKLD